MSKKDKKVKKMKSYQVICFLVTWMDQKGSDQLVPIYLDQNEELSVRLLPPAQASFVFL